MRKRSQFTQEFKREAVRLLAEGSKPPVEKETYSSNFIKLKSGIGTESLSGNLS